MDIFHKFVLDGYKCTPVIGAPEGGLFQFSQAECGLSACREGKEKRVKSFSNFLSLVPFSRTFPARWRSVVHICGCLLVGVASAIWVIAVKINLVA